MQIRKIIPMAGIAITAGISACTHGQMKKNSTEADNTAIVSSYKNFEKVKAPLTQDFLGKIVEYKSKDDSTKANKYLKKVVDDALPIEELYDSEFAKYAKLYTERKSMIEKKDSAGIKQKNKEFMEQSAHLDSIWDVLCTKVISADSINQYAKKSDLKKGGIYSYDWFKEALEGSSKE